MPATPRVGLLARRALGVSVIAAMVSAVLPITPAYAGSVSVVSTNDVPQSTAAPNTGSAKVVLDPEGLYTPSATVTFTRNGSGNDRVTATVDSATFGNVTVTVPLTLANPGNYNITITDGGPQTDTCTACFSVVSPAPAITNLDPATVAQTGGSTLVVTGTGFARGNYPGTDANYNCPGCTAAPTLRFERNGIQAAGISITDTVNADGDSAPTPSTASTITKVIGVATDTPTGAYDVVVTNTDGKKHNCAGCFTVAPQMTNNAPTSPDPKSLGQGTTGRTITITGANFPTDLAGTIFDPNNSNNPAPGMTFSFARDSATTARFFNVSVDADATPRSRTLSLSSTSIRDTLHIPFAVSGAPVATSAELLNGKKDSYGQGATGVQVKVTGSGFSPGGTLLRFSPSTGITITASSSTTTTATATINIASDAPLGDRQIFAVNPDGGSALCANLIGIECALTISAAPAITSISPPSAGRGSTKSFTFTGTNLSDGTSAATPPSISMGGVTGGTSSLGSSNRGTVATYSNGSVSKTIVGPMPVYIVNNDTLGRSSCVTCFTITNLEVSGPGNASDSNDGTKHNQTVTGSGFAPTATVELVKFGLGSATVPPITGTVTTAPTASAPNASDGTSLIASFPLNGADPGTYAFRVTNPAGTSYPGVGQGGVFNVVAAGPSLTSVAPNSRGTGAVGETISLTGTGFGKNPIVTFSNPGVTATSVTRLDATRIDVVVSIAESAATGAGTLRITNTDNQGAQLPFTVVAGPKLSTTTPGISPSTRGIGTSSFPAAVRGQQGTFPATGSAALLFSGSHITASNVTVTAGTPASQVPPGAATDDRLNATVTVANGPVGQFDVIVRNTSNGGRATCAKCFTVTASPPAAPTAVTAAPGNGQATVSWTPGADNGATITSYRVTASPGGVSKTVTGNPAESSTTVTGLTNGVAYRFTVVARNSVGDGPASLLSAPVTPRTVPGTVTGLTASPGEQSVALSWTAPSNGGTTITEYVVTTTPGGTTTSVPGNTTSKTITGLTNGTAYTFTVKARNAAGDGAASQPATATPRTPTVPVAPTALQSAAGDGRVALSWTAPTDNGGATITGYTVKTALANGTPVKESPATGTSLTVINLVNGTTYQFTVVANNSKGASPASAPATATPRFATKLTSTRSVATPVAGQGITFSGVLSRTSSGTKIAGATVILTVDPEIGDTRTAQLTTDANGIWTTRQGHRYNSVVSVRFAGDADDASVSATSSKMPVSPRITRTAPANGSSSAATSTLLVKGSISPNKAGRTVVLHKNGTAYTTATVAADGTFSIPSRLPKGTYTLKVVIGASPGNVFGQSASFSITRT